MARMNLTDTVMKGAFTAAGGGIQRFAWEQSENTGLMVTGLAILSGFLLPALNIRGQMADQIGAALYNSGTAIGGWVTTEKVLNLGDRPRAAVGAGAGRRLPRGQRGPAQQARQVQAQAAAAAAGNGFHPGVSLSGINPNTGEQILSSRV